MRWFSVRAVVGLVLLVLLVPMIVPTSAAPDLSTYALPDALTVTQADGVTREVLSSGLPAGAPGQELILLRFTFASGAVIPPHMHPGMQTAYVVSGTLGYTVFCGTALVTHSPKDGTAPRTEILPATGETFLTPGDSFVEVEGLRHAGRNAGPGPLVLLVSSLLTAGQPASSVVQIKQAGTFNAGSC